MIVFLTLQCAYVNFMMTDKLEKILKYIPALILICYMCGFVIFNTHLMSLGIFDTNILNIRFIEAGILFLLLAPLILATTYFFPIKINLLGSITTAIFAFIMYNNALGTQDYSFLWKAAIVIVVYNTFTYLVRYVFLENQKKKVSNTLDGYLIYSVLIISSMYCFSFYFNEMPLNIGGGKNYKEVLILKEKRDNILHTDSLNQSDTLTIVYETEQFVYFKSNKSIKSIRKDLIIGEICIK